MPAGMELGSYLKFAACGILSMFIGAQIVHKKYEPLSDLEDYIEREIATYSDGEQIKIRTGIQAKKNRIEKEISQLPPDVQDKVRAAVKV